MKKFLYRTFFGLGIAILLVSTIFAFYLLGIGCTGMVSRYVEEGGGVLEVVLDENPVKHNYWIFTGKNKLLVIEFGDWHFNLFQEDLKKSHQILEIVLEERHKEYLGKGYYESKTADKLEWERKKFYSENDIPQNMASDPSYFAGFNYDGTQRLVVVRSVISSPFRESRSAYVFRIFKKWGYADPQKFEKWLKKENSK